MSLNKLTVQVQNMNFGLGSGLSWLDVTTDCKQVQGSQGLDGARGFMAVAGQCKFIFNNTNGNYTPADNRADTSFYYLENGRRIRWLVTLPSHDKIGSIVVNSPSSAMQRRLGQTITASGSVGSTWTLSVEMRGQSGLRDYGMVAVFTTSGGDVTVIGPAYIDVAWRTYTFVYTQPVTMTTLQVQLANAMRADEATTVEFRNVSLVHSAAPSTNVLVNGDFSNGVTGWTTSGTVPFSTLDDYIIGFDGRITDIQAAPFASGKNTVEVLAYDWLAQLELATTTYAEERNKRADQLITELVGTLPTRYWVQTPPGLDAERGKQVFDRVYDGYKESDTYLSTAIEAITSSENGIFWVGRDGMYRFANNAFHVRRNAREGRPRRMTYTLKSNPTDGQIATLFGQAYRYKTTPSAAFDIKIGTTTIDTMRSLVAAINYDTSNYGQDFHVDTTQHQTAQAELRDYPSVIDADGPTAHYRLNESSGVVADDRTSNGYDGTIAGTPTFGVAGAITGDGDTALRLDGTDDKVTLPSAIDIYLKSFTIEMWVKMASSPPTDQDIFSVFKDFVTHEALYVRVQNTGRLDVDFYNDSHSSATGVMTFGGSDYQHLVIVYNHEVTQLTVYVDGQMVIGPLVAGPYEGTSPATMVLGAFPAIAKFGKLDVDELAIYAGKALTLERIEAHRHSRYATCLLTKYLNENETGQLTISEGDKSKYVMVANRSTSRVVNVVTVTWRPATVTSGEITLGAIQSPVKIPPRTDATNMTFVKPGYDNIKDGRVGEQELVISYHDASGNIVGAVDVVDPVATTDYQVFEFADDDAHGYEYTAQPTYFWIANVVKSASEYKCTLFNNATGALYATKFQVRGKAVYYYDPLEETAKNETSIAYFQQRRIRREMSFNNEQEFAKSLAAYMVERYGTPFSEAQTITFEHTAEINGTYLLGLELMDTIRITESKTGLSAALHMIVRQDYTLDPSAGDYLQSLTFTLERLDQNAYLRLGHATYGIIDGQNRLYI